MRTSYRYIIVGAGSAGCALANRLSEDPASTVLLLEAGGRDANPFIHMPAGLAKLVRNTRINWNYTTEPERELHGRRLYWPRGKVLGGSSSINAMCYVRGQPQDYDAWAKGGAAGWSFAEVLPYFLRSERQQRGASEYHGDGGDLSVEDLRDHNALSDAFIAAAQSLGIARNDDFNGPEQSGVGFYQVTQRAGRRCSAAVAYLHPIKSRPNLTVATHALVERVLIDSGRAVGVQFRRDGQSLTASCDGEVLLCGGSINSPQLLMLSGVGPAEHLEQLSIRVAVDLPGVGRNLQDHLDVCTLYKSRNIATLDLNPLAEALAGLQYVLRRRGPGVSNIAEAGAFVRSQYGRGGRPDVQLHFVPAQLDDHGRNRLPGRGFTLHACFLRPRSRGVIRLRSARAADPPLIHANYLHDGYDLDVMVDAVRISREILNAPALERFRDREVFPGEDVRTRPQIVDFIRRKSESIYHPVGTCRMGADEHSVVDEQLRVHGVQSLRVVDAAVMPTLVSGNTNAPTIMIAEKAADLILGRRAARSAARPAQTLRPRVGATSSV